MAQTLDALRAMIEQSGESLYRIAQGADIQASQLSRLMRQERGLSIEAAERVADFLGYEITVRPKRPSKGRG